MSGKSYTMREMKSIVEYLVDNKLYGEIKGRKMWMDFANSKLTSRTWQSLKETFLKRVLPDIHNPYYKLTIEQINSFRSGFDVADRNKTKLEVHTISDDSNGQNENDQEPKNNGNDHEGETTAGENIKCSKIPPQNRSSADTVILESCYETADDILRELESNDKDMPEENDGLQSSKSLRDCITYSEPLTPMLQEVLADFASEPEDSDREGTMQIDETVQDGENTEDITQIPEPDSNIPKLKSLATDIVENAKELSTEVVEEVLAQELDTENIPENTSPKKQTENTNTKPENGSVNKKKDSSQADEDLELGNNAENGIVETTEITKQDKAETVTEAVNGTTNNEISVANVRHSDSIFGSQHQNSHNSSTGTVDASLPNNPEGLTNKQSQNIDNKPKETPETSKTSVEVSSKSDTSQIASTTGRKRSSSEDTIKMSAIEKKKQKLEVRLKAQLKATKKGSKPITQSGIKIQDEKIKKAELKPTNKDKEEVMDIDIIQESDTNKNVTEIEKPSTSHDIEEITAQQNRETEESHNKNEPTEMKNPCLQNVSLYDEQFNKTKYNMSESSDTEQNKKETSENTQEGTSKADDVVEKVQDEPEAKQTRSPPKKKHRSGVLTSKSERDKAISHMFGHNISGGVSSKRRRQLNRRSRTISHNNMSHNAPVSNSSEWTSESESETFISPPRGRKNRQTRKYLKPRSARILSLEEEGGLFVMYGKKIYPLIKDGKIVKNYLTYLPESDSEEGESYWKHKYEEEKRKAAELKKLLEEAKEPPAKEPNAPIQPANPLRNTKSNYNQAQETSNGNDQQICLPSADNKKEVNINPPEKIMIKFTKNNEEVHLEGHWPQIHPVLEQVVQIFHKEVEPSVSNRQSRMMVEPPLPSKEPSSGASTPLIITPIDPEIHEKVNKIEKEIFKEIEQRDKEEEILPTVSEILPTASETNVTKRKGRPRKSSSSVTLSPQPEPKILRQSTSRKTLQSTTPNPQDATENATKEQAPKRQTKTPRKLLNETVNINETKTIQTRRSKQNLSSPEDSGKYMLRPKSLRLSKSPTKKKANLKTKKSSKESSMKSPPPEILNSIDSTQGYQDSDESPVRIEIRKKKMYNQSSFIIKTRNSLRRSSRRRSHPYLYCDAYNDSSNSSNNGSIEIVARENSSLNTDVYRSESYQLLMPQAKSTRSRLESIDETSPINSDTYFVKHLESMSKTEGAQNSNFGRGSSDIGSSSNISLPMSPELSVVESISISKDMLSLDYYPTINEMQSNDLKEATGCSNYMISAVDVSVPLMEQDCGLENCDVEQSVTPAVNATDPKSVVTESLLSKIGTINIEEQVTATDTLNQKLHDLLLESAKKIKNSNKESMMDVDDTNVETKKKAKAKKRCSTPRKRKVTKKSVAPTVEPVVEEHVELCSHSGRKSCPPFFQTLAAPENVTQEIATLTIDDKKSKLRKKKDIIRVKIQRPKSKKSDDKLKKSSAQDVSKISVYTDSGINESGVFLPIDDSVDLIHNHSETCLLANDCAGDSVEFVDNSKSVITLNDTTKSADNLWNSRSEYDDAENISPDFFCNNAQDMHSFYKKANTDNTSDTVYHSPPGTEISNNSLITEDLSDDIPPPKSTKWYLLSDEETTNTNTNMVGQGTTMLSVGNYGSNLKQLFPIACAVPDLSTITEFSTENDSRKPTLELDGLNADDFNSRMFDSNF